MIGGSVPDLDRCPFLHPFFSRLVDFKGKTTHMVDGGIVDRVGSYRIMTTDKLAQHKADDVGRLPEAGVKEVRQTVGGKI